MLRNFVLSITKATANWSMGSFVERQVEEIRQLVGDGHVICGLSGGVDSSVAAALIHRAIGQQLHCIFVDNGVLRKGEREQVAGEFTELDLHVVDARDRFLDRLSGVTDPERKRKIIGNVFIEVFEEEANRLKEEFERWPGWLKERFIQMSSNRFPFAVHQQPLRATTRGLPDHMELEPLSHCENYSR